MMTLDPQQQTHNRALPAGSKLEPAVVAYPAPRGREPRNAKFFGNENPTGSFTRKLGLKSLASMSVTRISTS